VLARNLRRSLSISMVALVTVLASSCTSEVENTVNTTAVSWHPVYPVAGTPPTLMIDGVPVPPMHADWRAAGGVPQSQPPAMANATWTELPATPSAGRTPMRFSAGPIPIAYSFVGYSTDDDGAPAPREVLRVSAVLPTGVMRVVGEGLSVDLPAEPQFLAVQFEWRVPPAQLVSTSTGAKSVTATYLLHRP